MHDLQEARVLPGLNNLAFDVSHVIPPTSWYGTLLKGVFNFSPATTKLELAAWLLYVIPTLTIFLVMVHRRTHAKSPNRSAPGPLFLPEGNDHDPRLTERRILFASTCAALTVPMLAACTDNAPSGSPSAGASANPRALSVQATDTACTLSAQTPRRAS